MLTESDRLQIERLASRAKDRSSRNFAEQLKAIFTDHSAKGVLRSGATIKAAIRQMETAAREAMNELLAEVSAVSRTDEAFASVAEAVQDIITALGNELPHIFHMVGEQTGSAASSAALGLYRTMKSDIEADLVIARHQFVSGKMPEAGEPPSPMKNRGGKPLAEHWDEMWAAIAVQLWTGDLQPKRQGDVKRAMLNWFTEKGINVGDTAVTERARALWQKIEAAK